MVVYTWYNGVYNRCKYGNKGCIKGVFKGFTHLEDGRGEGGESELVPVRVLLVVGVLGMFCLGVFRALEGV